MRQHGFRSAGNKLLNAFEANQILTFASAISFQIVFSLIPFALAAVAVLGFADLADVWRADIAPLVRDRVSDPTYRLLDRAVTRILESGHGFWLTAGLALALWEVSGAVRATMGALNRIYRVKEERSFARRLALSVALSIVVAVAVTTALAVLHLGAELAPVVGLDRSVAVVGRWLPVVLLLLFAVALLVRYAPAQRRPASSVSLVTVVIVALWIAVSLGFALYVAELGSYASIYGGLAAVVVGMTYVYLSVLVFLSALQLEALMVHEGRFRSDREGA